VAGRCRVEADELVGFVNDVLNRSRAWTGGRWRQRVIRACFEVTTSGPKVAVQPAPVIWPERLLTPTNTPMRYLHTSCEGVFLSERGDRQ